MSVQDVCSQTSMHFIECVECRVCALLKYHSPSFSLNDVEQIIYSSFIFKKKMTETQIKLIMKISQQGHPVDDDCRFMGCSEDSRNHTLCKGLDSMIPQVNRSHVSQLNVGSTSS